MTDTVSESTRSHIMSRVRRRDTGPELLLRRALWAIGARGWRVDDRRLPGRPDLAFTRLRVAVFVDGAFWHGHPRKFTLGKSGSYWDVKIARNVRRDREVNDRLTVMGWHVVRLWDFDVQAAPEEAARRVLREIARAG